MTPRRSGLLLLLALSAAPAFVRGADDGPGWTELPRAPKARLIHVSSSAGEDENDGARDRPVRSLRRAASLVRDGHPDRVLLRRGDVWRGERLGWHTSGRPGSPQVIESYGDPGAPRARVLDGGFATSFKDEVSHLAIVGLHFEREDERASATQAGIAYLAHGRDVLIEDCVVVGFKDNLNVQGRGGRLASFRLRRCVVAGAYSSQGGHAQGLYLAGVDEAEVVDCVFVRNGLRHGLAGAEPTIFNHGAYVATDCGPVRFTGNIVALSSSHGLQLRSGGRVERNLFAGNPIALLIGGGDQPVAGGVTATVRANWIHDGRDLGSAPRSWGIDGQNLARGSSITGNVISRGREGVNAFALRLKADGWGAGAGVTDLLVEGNTVVDWPGGLVVRAPAGAAPLSGLRVERNLVVSRTWGPLLTFVGPWSDERATFAGNRWRSVGPPDTWFAGPHAPALAERASGGEAPDVAGPELAEPLRRARPALGSPDLEGLLTWHLGRAPREWRPELAGAALADFAASSAREALAR